MAAKKKTAKKKTAKKKTATPGKRVGRPPKGSGPSKSDFIRANPTLSALELVAKAKEQGMSLSAVLVYKVRGRTKAKTEKPAAAKSPPVPAKRSGRTGGASAWIREQLAAGKTAADVWAAATEAGQKFSRNLIYAVQSADKLGKSPKASKAPKASKSPKAPKAPKGNRAPKPEAAAVSPTVNLAADAVEEQFQTFVAKLGLTRIEELVRQAKGWGRAFGVG